MRRVLALVLMILLMCPVALACEECEGGAVWETGDMLVVSNCREWVSLRSTANTKALRIAKIPLGKQVYFVGYGDNGFAHVYYDGKYGYVLEDYLVYDGVSIRFAANCEEWISLRKAASTGSERLIKIPKGEMVHTSSSEMENGSRFAWANYGGYGGYVLKEYLSLLPFEAGDVLNVADCDQWVSLRQAPSVKAERLAQVPLGAAVTVLGEAENGFVRVQYQGRTGYVLAGYLEESSFYALDWL